MNEPGFRLSWEWVCLRPNEFELSTDFSTKGLASQDIQAIVAAWQAGAISRDTMTELFRRGEVLPEGRTTEEEEALIGRRSQSDIP